MQEKVEFGGKKKFWLKTNYPPGADLPPMDSGQRQHAKVEIWIMRKDKAE